MNVEVDGREFHDSPRQRARDATRDNALTKAGWHVVRLRAEHLHDELRGKTAEDIRRLVATRASSVQAVAVSV